MGMIAYIYTAEANYSAGGTTSRHTRCCVVNVEGPFNPSDDLPGMMLVMGPGKYPIVVDAVQDPAGNWVQRTEKDLCGPMYGGQICDASDSRWNRAVRRMIFDRMTADGLLSDRLDRAHSDYLPVPSSVPIHDRFETWEQYDRLTR